MVKSNLKLIREMRNLTQEFMAQELNVSQAQYSRMENNPTDLPLSKAQKIAEILEVSLTDLLNFDDKNIFNNCKVDVVNNYANINYTISPEIKKLYEDTIKLLEEKIALLEKK